MKLAVFVHEPYFTSRILEMNKQAGNEASVCESADALPMDVSVVFVDLSATAFDPIYEIARIKSSRNIHVTGFISSVQVDMKERAEKAGADEVLPRSAMMDCIEDALGNERRR